MIISVYKVIMHSMVIITYVHVLKHTASDVLQRTKDIHTGIPILSLLPPSPLLAYVMGFIPLPGSLA